MTTKFDIGIDPDSHEHGIAIYENGRLIELCNLSLFGVYGLRKEQRFLAATPTWHIENVFKTEAIFHADKTHNKKTDMEIARRVGSMQQSAKDLVDMLGYFFPYDRLKFYAISSKWKGGAEIKQFKLATQWKGQSNKDTRSAAYFGFLGCDKR